MEGIGIIMYISEFQELGNSIKNGAIFLIALSVVFCSLPAATPVAVLVFRKVQADLLPAGVRLVVADPFSAFFAQMLVSLFLALVVAFPWFLYGLVKYLSPALFEHEKKALAQVIFPAVMLFLLGCGFSYTLLIPQTFKLLYPFTTAINALPLFPVNGFIGLVFTMMTVVGAIFLLPVGMVLMNSCGIVDRAFWLKNWRTVMFAFVVFAAIITPDGTGVTMVLLCVPFAALYFLGAFIRIK